MFSPKPLLIRKSQSGKTTTIRCIVVRETYVSQHHPIKDRLEMPRTSQHRRIEEFKWALYWAPIMPRDAVSQISNVIFPSLERKTEVGCKNTSNPNIIKIFGKILVKDHIILK